MTARSRLGAIVAWSALALMALLAVAGCVLVAANDSDLADDLVFVTVFFAMGVVACVIVSRQAGNAVGWLMLMTSGTAALLFFSYEYGYYGLVTEPGSLPGSVWFGWLSQWAWIVTIGFTITLVLLLFPDGRLPSPRWRWFARANVAFVAVTAFAFATAPGPMDDLPARNPLGIAWMDPIVTVLDGAGYLVLLLFMVGAVVSLVFRYRRADGEERHQIKWFVFAAALMASAFVFQAVADAAGLGLPFLLETVVPAIGFLALPTGIATAMLRYRLYDIDVVINKALVFAALALFFTVVYVAVVIGVGALVGSRGNLVLSVVATAVIAVAFQPFRERARRLANRMVYGPRATPYEVLSQFADRVGGAYGNDDFLQRMARVVAEGTGASSAQVWLQVGHGLVPAASWPVGSAGPASIDLGGGDTAEVGGARVFAVRHQSDLLGAIAVMKPPSEPLSPAEEGLLRNVASQAGLVIRNVRLTAELQARLDEISHQAEELRASRQRIVAAQDSERRRIERNIHDGAQQRLVALAVRLRLARQLVGRDPAAADEMLRGLEADTGEALEELRDLARGIYPPVLADQGLVAAVEGQARRAAVPVEVAADRVGRYPPEAEAAVYFSVLEALQNVAKYAGEGVRAEVRLGDGDGGLSFSVTDDGAGFDPATAPAGSGIQGMRDRLEALGGALDVRSVPGRGTTVSGTIPVTAVVGADGSS